MKSQIKMGLNLVAMLMVMLAFQNCTKPMSTLSPSPLPNLQNSNDDDNGHPYTGIQPKSGIYYSQLQNFSCPSGSVGPQFPNVDKIITVADQQTSATVTDNCTNTQTTVPVSSLSVSQINSDYLTFSSSIFQNHPQPPTPDTPIPIVFCGFPATGSFLGFEQVIVALPSLNTIARVSIYGIKDPITGLPTPMMEQTEPVGNGTGQYPTNVPAVAFYNPSIPYGLLVSGLMPAPAHHPGYLNAVVAGTVVSIAGECIDPNYVPPTP